ncbi:MFS-type efflux pump MSMEG_3705-like [Nematostella vectensis]|uniref:MFS-type efflux pump MSMEG_3705-like n=1 Tax=Nematostella vectensis TaxID=45351 RepID=UPI002076DAB3|nr:MFS-type efflux pump MSMEG_3705-like [Nematostella vectensis]
MALRFLAMHKEAGPYPMYVLLLLLAAYLLNQLDRYILAVTSQPMAQSIKFGDKGCLALNTSYTKYTEFCVKSLVDKEQTERNETWCRHKKTDNLTFSVCRWDYDGTGEEYQILAGPAFIVIYTFSGVILGLFTGTFNRKNILVFCLLLWSGMTLLTGFSTTYWHLLVTRFILGIGEAGCTPFATSLIADYFPESLRGTALGVYNWGIYLGYSMSYAFGNYITKADIGGKGWRWVFWIAAIPGFVVGALIVFTLKEPVKGEQAPMQNLVSKSAVIKLKLVLMLKTFRRPTLLILFLAGAIRNAGGYVWAYNTQPYFNKYYPETDVGRYMSWIPLVAGSCGVVLGGFISDRLVKDRGPHARIWVLVGSQIIAAPFAAGALFLPTPWAFISLLPSNIIGEMWVGVTLAVVVELVPNTIRTAAIAGYLFIITIIGGNIPLLVPPLKKVTSLRTALYILYPGLYVVSSVLFLLTLFVLKRDIAKKAVEEDVIQPLLPDNPNSESKMV